MRDVSYVQRDGRGSASATFKVLDGVWGVSHVQGDRRPSAMFKLLGGVKGVSHVQGDGRGG